MKKIGVTTVYTGFNYGSCLQAYASQTFLESMGYDVNLLWYKDGLVKGRDIRIKKILGMGARTVFRPNLFKKTFFTYKNSLKKEINSEVKNYFFEFQENRLKVKKENWSGLKRFAEDDTTLACVCGSDQIWNATNVYVDPIFYLRFAPRRKRVAYAPSLGKSFIPDYNKKIIKTYSSDFDYLSVREEQGAKLLNELIDREVRVVLDPTLLLDKIKWLEISDKTMKLPREYMLVYFLDKPTEVALTYIKEYSKKYNLDIISIPYKFDEYSNLSKVNYVNAGPEQFINLVANAKFVFTDSFHGMVFSANFNSPFYIFQRNYGTAANQSSRITSILKKISLESRFISEVFSKEIKTLGEINLEMDFEDSNRLLKEERLNSKQYLINAFNKIEQGF